MNYKKCQYCEKPFKVQGLHVHEKMCKNKSKNSTVEKPTIINKEYLLALHEEADRLENQAKELRAFVTQLEQYPYDQLNGFVLMIAKKA